MDWSANYSDNEGVATKSNIRTPYWNNRNLSSSRAYIAKGNFVFMFYMGLKMIGVFGWLHLPI